MLGNVAVPFSCTCLGKNLKPSNVFLLNMALCDSAWPLNRSLTIYFRFKKPYPDGIKIFCKFKRISVNMNMYGSIVVISLISFDRYVGTAHPISSLRWWKVGKAKIFSVLTWVGLVLSIIPDLYVTLIMQQSENTSCAWVITVPFLCLKYSPLAEQLYASCSPSVPC